jgi:hypothetical protein
MTDIATILDRAADRLSKPGAWTQGAFSRGAKGRVDDEENLTARRPTCWCALGAIAKEARVNPASNFVWSGQGRAPAAYRALMAVLPRPADDDQSLDIPDWNDAPERTQSEVVAALRNAAARARGDA